MQEIGLKFQSQEIWNSEWLFPFQQLFKTIYSRVPNNWGVWNNRGGWKLFQKLIIVEGGWNNGVGVKEIFTLVSKTEVSLTSVSKTEVKLTSVVWRHDIENWSCCIFTRREHLTWTPPNLKTHVIAIQWFQ